MCVHIAYIRVYTYICVCVYIYVCVYECVSACVHIRVSVLVHVHVLVYVYVYTYVMMNNWCILFCMLSIILALTYFRYSFMILRYTVAVNFIINTHTSIFFTNLFTLYPDCRPFLQVPSLQPVFPSILLYLSSVDLPLTPTHSHTSIHNRNKCISSH